MIRIFPYEEVVDILERLETGGWRVELEGSSLIVRGNVLPKALKEEIKEKKNLIIQFLTGNIVETNEEKLRQSFYKVFGVGIKILLPNPEPKPCYTCGGSYWWISKDNGHLYCVTCHPPVSEEIVAGWVGKIGSNIRKGADG